MESQERCDAENRMFQAAIRQRAFELFLPALIGFLALLFPAAAHAQSLYYLQNGGRPTFNTPTPVEKGFIDLANGDLHLEIPLASPAQRGSMTTNARMVYDGRIWVIVDNGTSKSWQPTNLYGFTSGGWSWVYSDTNLWTAGFQDVEYCSGSSYTAYYGPYVTAALDGTVKFFPINTPRKPCPSDCKTHPPLFSCNAPSSLGHGPCNREVHPAPERETERRTQRGAQARN